MDDGNIGGALLLTVILIAINGMLASAELAMLGLGEGKLQAKADSGDKKAKLLLRMKQNPSNFLSTIQIGITLAGLLSGAFAADTLAKPIVRWAADLGAVGASLTLIRGGATFLITLLMTFFMLVFGELVPKRIAMARPEKTAQGVINPIYALSKIASPLVRLLSAATNGILKLLGIDPNHEEAVTEEDVLLMMRAGHQQGRIEAMEVQMVANLFEFTDLRVAQAMTHRTELKVLSIDGTLEDVVAKMSETGFNKFPVIDGNVDRIVGVLYSKDIVTLYPLQQEHASIPTVRECMRQPYFVPESKMLVQLFGEMKRGGERIAVVVDAYGGTSGIITLMDIIEEIVGDLNGSIRGGITEQDDGSYLIDGRLDWEDVAELLELSDLEDESDTFSGFLVSRLGYVPKRGEHPTVSVQGCVFQVEEMEWGLIRSASATKLPQKPAPAQ